MVKNILEAFAGLPDPRWEHPNKLHKLIEKLDNTSLLKTSSIIPLIYSFTKMPRVIAKAFSLKMLLPYAVYPSIYSILIPQPGSPSDVNVSKLYSMMIIYYPFSVFSSLISAFALDKGSKTLWNLALEKVSEYFRILSKPLKTTLEGFFSID